jgi:autotransporter-associated beta strand protein
LNNTGGFFMGAAANAHNLSVTGSFTTNATGTAKFNGGVTTTTTQTYSGAVELIGDTTFTTTDSAVTFSSTVDGTTTNTESITIAAGSGDTTFTGAVGGTTSLKNITVTTAALTAAAIKADTSITITNSAASTISGIISGDATLTKAGASTLTLSGANTYAGATALNAGSLILANTSGTTISDNNAVTMASDTTLDLRYSETLGSLAGAGTITTGSSGAKTLTVGGLNTDTAFSGVIQNGSGSLLLTKSGTGTLSLTGTNTYTGATVINGGGLVFENNTPSITTSSFSGSGSLLIRSAGDAFASAYDFNKTTTGLAALTIGKATNTANITISAAQSIDGPITIYGGNVDLTANLNTTGGAAAGDILIKASGDIALGLAKTITTTGGDLILWANSDGGLTNGGVFFDQGSSIATSGGHIWVGGSVSANSSTTWNGLTVGDGYTVSGKTLTSFGKRGATSIDWHAGVLLDETTINSAGGNIYIAAKRNSGAALGAGLINYSGTNGTLIDSGSGTIVIKGESADVAGRADFGVMTGLHPVITLVS